MTKSEAVQTFLTSGVFDDWHWFAYHFRFYVGGYEHPFAKSIVEACLDCETRLPGYTAETARRIGELRGRDRHEPHYEQLLQLLAELLVVRQVVTASWPEGTRFEHEPTAPGSRRNPEVGVFTPEMDVLVEVKAPALLAHQRLRGANPTQVPARADEAVRAALVADGEPATLPRDNPVKDFLISADGKFSPFKRAAGDRRVIGVLAIVWDDFVYEPLSSLVATQSGLFTDRSFATDEEGQPLAFSSVDGVVLIRHLHQFARAAADKTTGDEIRHALDYGFEGGFPPKAHVSNPHGEEVPGDVLTVLQAYEWDTLEGAEYSPKDVVWWLPVPGHEGPGRKG